MKGSAAGTTLDDLCFAFAYLVDVIVLVFAVDTGLEVSSSPFLVSCIELDGA